MMMPMVLVFCIRRLLAKDIGAVAHLLRGVHDAFAGFDIDGRMVFQSTAYGSGRKAKVFCNIIDRNIFFSLSRV